MLRLFASQQRGQAPLKLSEPANVQLFKALGGNLCMNSSTLRLETLRVLSLFEVIDYLFPEEEDAHEVS